MSMYPFMTLACAATAVGAVAFGYPDRFTEDKGSDVVVYSATGTPSKSERFLDLLKQIDASAPSRNTIAPDTDVLGAVTKPELFTGVSDQELSRLEFDQASRRWHQIAATAERAATRLADTPATTTPRRPRATSRRASTQATPRPAGAATTRRRGNYRSSETMFERSRFGQGMSNKSRIRGGRGGRYNMSRTSSLYYRPVRVNTRFFTRPDRPQSMFEQSRMYGVHGSNYPLSNVNRQFRSGR